jgi:hypothetical protein
MKILFLLKKNLIYGSYNSVIAKSGLLNSARITAHQLKKHLDFDTQIEVCVDGNGIDHFIHRHRPSVVILEALWVTPAKLKELHRLHRHVSFITLMHSETAFLAHEGNAVEWLQQYADINKVYPAFNSRQAYTQFSNFFQCLYLPNIYYDVDSNYENTDSLTLNIGCFGAIRPFKNQLIQAMASKVIAKQTGRHLHFHMNTSRLEQGGESVYKNIKALLGHSLKEHDWMERWQFLELIKTMDIGMQVSFTESFNIVAADFVHESVPCVVGTTIDWMPNHLQCNPESLENIVDIALKALGRRKRMAERQTEAMIKYNKLAIKQWKGVFDK